MAEAASREYIYDGDVTTGPVIMGWQCHSGARTGILTGKGLAVVVLTLSGLKKCDARFVEERRGIRGAWVYLGMFLGIGSCVA